MSELTPMMKQYMEVKENYRDCLLFYRLGDFYEMFFEDAVTASRELDLVLTGRDCGLAERAPMCGVPYHSCDGYIAKLIRKGYKIAICEQTEDPALAKGLVRREVIRIVTPGTVTDYNLLDEKSNNYLSAVYADDSGAGVCFADITTGDLFATEIEREGWQLRLVNEIGRFGPKEAVINRAVADNPEVADLLFKRLSCAVESGDETLFEEQKTEERILTQFRAESLADTGFEGAPHAARAVSALLQYLRQTQKQELLNLGSVHFYNRDMYMELDMPAFRNLEICETLRTKEKRGSLLWVLDETRTAMGSRMLRSYVEKPLLNVAAITRRQAAVAELVRGTVVRGELGSALKGLFDLERLMGRIVYGSAGARDLVALAQTAAAIPGIRPLVEGIRTPLLQEIAANLDDLADIRDRVEKAVVDAPPFSVREGGLIRNGYDAEIDRLRYTATHGRELIAGIEAKEREQTGIKGLKIGYNRVFGYYIEVTKSYMDQVPDHYVRKQTLANCERYITDELKKIETDVLTAQEQISALEYELFCELRNYAASQIHRVQRTAQALAMLDVLLSFAEAAVRNQYVCPEIDLSDRIEITEGRHPVVEKMMSGGLFVPNDTKLDCGDNRMAIITGPNMAGKSTYMRQVALIVLMAQIGSFVPAKSARIGVVDRIFTRIGASDDLAGGMSTFMVEMSEVAEIVRHATRKSLILYDEIGRGTSTFDGMAIARAVLEYTADRGRLGAKTLFATHYHELSELEETLEGVKNYNISVKKRGEEIIFLRKIIRGGADDSYGIEVARLAGIPPQVISRAKQILAALEEGRPVDTLQRKKNRRQEAEDAPTLLGSAQNGILSRLAALDINTLTPIEALNLLNELSREAKSV